MTKLTKKIIKKYKDKHFQKGYNAGVGVKFSADFQMGVGEYLGMKPKDIVDYTSLCLENTSRDSWQKVTFYVRITDQK